MYSSLYLLVCVYFVVYLYFKNAFSYWKRKGVEYISPSIPFGNIGKVALSIITIGDGFRGMYEEIKGRFGGMYSFVYPGVVVKDPELIKHVLVKDFNIMCDRGFYTDEKNEPLSAHLFRKTGEDWRLMRKYIARAFTSTKMKTIFPTLKKVANNLQFSLESNVNSNIDIMDYLSRYNADIISSAVLGMETNSFLERDNEYFRMVKDLIANFPRSRMIKFVLIVLAPKLLEIFKPKTVQDHQVKYISKVVMETIKHREATGTRKLDLVQILIDLMNNNEIFEDNSPKEDIQQNFSININDICAQAFTYYFAGIESTSSSMMFLCYLCALNPEVQNKIQMEIDEVVKESGDKITFESLAKLEYLDRCFSESLRLYPVIPHLDRVLASDYKFAGSNVNLEKGTRVFISISGLHHDSAHYPDPEKFNPDRFLPEEVAKRNPFTYLPFGAGPRICIAQKMGQLMLRLGLATIFKNFTLSVCNETELKLKFTAFTYSYKTARPVILKLTRRG